MFYKFYYLLTYITFYCIVRSYLSNFNDVMKSTCFLYMTSYSYLPSLQVLFTRDKIRIFLSNRRIRRLQYKYFLCNS